MTVKFAQATLSTQPSTMGWVQRQNMGDDNQGNPTYPAPREFHLEWDIIDATSYNELQLGYQGSIHTGIDVTLPQYGSSYADRDYSGCVIQEPAYQEYFEQHYYGVRLLIVSIRS